MNKCMWFRLGGDPHTYVIHVVVTPPTKARDAMIALAALCGATPTSHANAQPSKWDWVQETRHLHLLCPDCLTALPAAYAADRS